MEPSTRTLQAFFFLYNNTVYDLVTMSSIDTVQVHAFVCTACLIMN